MLNLTNAMDNKPLHISARHIVSVRDDRGQTFVHVSTGVDYAVKESVDEVENRFYQIEVR